jgi:rhodanese-related sulfurtransferase
VTILAINPQAFANLCNEGKKIDLIDVRTPVEYREVHLEIAQSVPLDQLDVLALMKARNNPAHEPMYVICRSGSRGQQACEQFLKAGFSSVVNIEGGTLAWVKRVCRSCAARMQYRLSGKCASRSDRSCCWVRSLRGSSIRHLLGYRLS